MIDVLLVTLLIVLSMAYLVQVLSVFIQFITDIDTSPTYRVYKTRKQIFYDLIPFVYVKHGIIHILKHYKDLK